MTLYWRLAASKADDAMHQDVDVCMRHCLLSCRFDQKRFRSTQSLETLLNVWKTREHERIVHVERERVERGEYAGDSGVLGSVLGHDHKKRAVEPDPRSLRWRQSFLRVGAFRKRSVRIEVRKKEFGPDEILHASVPELPPEASPSPDPATIEGIPLDVFADYVDQRLADMETHDVLAPRAVDPLQDDACQREDLSQTSHCVEFRTLPFDTRRAETGQTSKVSPKNWTSSGRRLKERNRFRAVWMHEWAHMWSQMYGKHWVPSSVRRFYHHLEYTALPRRAHLYVEDGAVPEGYEKGGMGRDVAIVLEFLKTQPAFQGPSLTTSARKNTLWPERRQGMARWSFIQDLSDAIREGHFRFDWEKQKCLEARFYAWNQKKRRRNLPKEQSTNLRLFGQEAPLKIRFPSLIRESIFRPPSGDVDDERDSDLE